MSNLVEMFVGRLQEKVNSEIKLSFQLDRKGQPSYFDAPRPTSTGKTKEDDEEYGA